MNRVLVTGATGFVARHFIPQLQAKGWEVVGVARSSARPRWLEGIDWLNADLGQWQAARELLARTMPQALVHLAGQVHGPWAELCAANVTSASMLLQAARELAPRMRLVLFGSAAEYGAAPESALPIDESTRCEPLGGYGATKLAATHLALAAAQQWQAPVSVVRPFNIVGAHMPPAFVAGALIKRIDDALRAGGNQAITIGRTDTTRDFVDVGDLSAAIVTLLDREATGEVYNLCSGRETRISDLLGMLVSMAGSGLIVQRDPTLIRPGDVARSFGSCAKARAQLGFEPRTGLEESLRAAWQARLMEAA